MQNTPRDLTELKAIIRIEKPAPGYDLTFPVYVPSNDVAKDEFKKIEVGDIVNTLKGEYLRIEDNAVIPGEFIIQRLKDKSSFVQSWTGDVLILATQSEMESGNVLDKK